MDSADVIRFLLIAVIVVLFILAMLSLRRRKVGLLEFCCLGLLALLVPLLGPFLVIALRPGRPRAAAPARAPRTQRVIG